MIAPALMLALACAAPVDPDLVEAVAPTLQVLDRGGDGAVGHEDYEAARYAGPGFEEVDADGDGTLDAVELARLASTQDPVTFDPVMNPNKTEAAQDAGGEPNPPPPPAPGRPGPPVPAGGLPPGATPAEADLQAVLVFLVDELARIDPDAPRPEPARIAAAAAGGELAGVETQAVLRELEVRFRAAGAPFPPGLLKAP